MKYLRIKIKPTSPFATEPVGDTLFGQICYTLFLMNEDIDEILQNYETDPFLVVSDMFPLGYALKPCFPVKPNKVLNINKLSERKKLKNKNRVLLDNIINTGKLLDYDISEPKWQVLATDITHVLINRIADDTNTSYVNIDYFYSLKENDDFIFDLYLYVKDEYKDIVIKALDTIGRIGYGKKSTIGKGRFSFSIDDIEYIIIETTEKNSLFTLSGCVISGLNIYAEYIFYTPYVRFGKHGIATAYGIPFKNPYVMAEQGMLLNNIKDKTIFDKPYIGKAITGISHKDNTVAQGYSLYIPIEFRGEYD